ncbi:hypothetical protein HPB47_026748 [Ixodes persulcatus]|uniref:Uncharacterized protein n=1 Tax=Ixodes persulcatus TaxID=34615 RepID=A0AC60PYB7_IXOPE|nr:hypothetical protein HPB47_026748 [Ixodes persulcatus]
MAHAASKKRRRIRVESRRFRKITPIGRRSLDAAYAICRQFFPLRSVADAADPTLSSTSVARRVPTSVDSPRPPSARTSASAAASAEEDSSCRGVEAPAFLQAVVSVGAAKLPPTMKTSA